MKRRAMRGSHAVRMMEATAWAVACLAVLVVVVWHDGMVSRYWDGKDPDRLPFLIWDRNRVPPDEPYAVWLSIMRFEADLSVGLLAASAGMVLVNATRRIRVRRAWRGAGVVACVAAVAGMGLCVLEEASLALQERRGLWGRSSNPFPNAWPNLELRIGLAVLGAWVVLVGSRRWRRSRSWADRIGIAIGSSWLMVVLYRLFASLFIPFSNWGY